MRWLVVVTALALSSLGAGAKTPVPISHLEDGTADQQVPMWDATGGVVEYYQLDPATDVCDDGTNVCTTRALISGAATPASTGVVRLGDAEEMCWRWLAKTRDACIDINDGDLTARGGTVSPQASGAAAHGGSGSLGGGVGGELTAAGSGDTGGIGGTGNFSGGQGGAISGGSGPATAGAGGTTYLRGGYGGTATGAGNTSGNGGNTIIGPGDAGGALSGASSGTVGQVRIAQTVNGPTYVGSGGLRVGANTQPAISHELEVAGVTSMEGHLLLDDDSSPLDEAWITVDDLAAPAPQAGTGTNGAHGANINGAPGGDTTSASAGTFAGNGGSLYLYGGISGGASSGASGGFGGTLDVAGGNGAAVTNGASGAFGGFGGDAYLTAGLGGNYSGTNGTAGWGGDVVVEAGGGGNTTGAGNTSGTGGILYINPGAAGSASSGASPGAPGQVRIAQLKNGPTYIGSGGLRVGDNTQPAIGSPLEVLGNVLLDNAGTAAELRLREPSGDGSNYTGFKAGTMSTSPVYTMPTDPPTVDGQQLASTTVGVMSWGPGGPNYVDVQKQGLACDHSADVTADFQALLDATDNNAVFIPSGCKLLLSGPVAGDAALTIPSGKSIICADRTAGFWLASKRCTTGQNAGSWCSTDSDCTDCGGACSGSTCTFDDGSGYFAPTADSVYTVLKTAVPTSGNTIQGCGFFVNQMNPFLACDSGTHAGKPCQQYCVDGTVPGSTCRTDSDCGGGTCANAVCGATDTCTTAATVRPSGDGDIVILDGTGDGGGQSVLARDLAVYDLTRSTGVVKVPERSLVSQLVMDCSRPIYYTGTTVTTTAMNLCWPSWITTPAAILTQPPALAIDAAVTVGVGSAVRDSKLLTSTTGIVGGVSARIVGNEIPNGLGTGALPYTPMVTGYGINAAGAYAVVRSNGITAAASGVAVNVGGDGSIIEGNRLSASGTGGIAVRLVGDFNRVANNYIAAFTGVMVTVGSINNSIIGNTMFGGSGAKVWLTGPGNRVVGNYMAWGSGAGGLCSGGDNVNHPCLVASQATDCPGTGGGTCTPAPVMWIGSPDAGYQSGGVAGATHSTVSDNEFYTATSTPLVKFAALGSADNSQQLVFNNNHFLNGSIGLDMSALASGGHTLGPTVVNGNYFGTTTGMTFPTDTAAVTSFVAAANRMSDTTNFANWNANFGTLGGETKIVLNAGGANGATGAPAWDLPTTGAATVPTALGTTTTSGVLAFADGSTQAATAHFTLPGNWAASAGVNVRLTYTGSLSSTNNIRWQVSTACVADGETLASPTYNTASASNSAGPTTTPQRKTATFQNVNTQSGSTCAADETMYLRVERVGADGGDTYTGSAYLYAAVVTLWRLQ